MKFEEWLDEIEVFSLRRERLYSEFPEVKDMERLLQWLEAAYKNEMARSSLQSR